jgi:hypothetical protein
MTPISESTEVADSASSRILSRGFASDTASGDDGQAKKLARTFHESLRFPAPRRRARESEET